MLSTTSSITKPSGFTNFLLAELRCASARARLIATEVDSVAVALGGGFIDIDLRSSGWARQVHWA